MLMGRIANLRFLLFDVSKIIKPQILMLKADCQQPTATQYVSKTTNWSTPRNPNIRLNSLITRTFGDNAHGGHGGGSHQNRRPERS